MTLTIELLATHRDDLDTLVQMRIAAMRESLERIGRFDPQRARIRFAESFTPNHCYFISWEEHRVGFMQATAPADHLWLQHLYITPGFQGRGFGAQALQHLIKRSMDEQLPIRLDALRESDSNRFYLRHGFVQTGESEWDIHYLRPAVPPADCSDHPRKL